MKPGVDEACSTYTFSEYQVSIFNAQIFLVFVS